ncbi:MAG: methionyl-tRNA formyltransferase [Pirellulaceae bacterium]
MRILPLGTGPFAVPTFRWLLDSSHVVPALVTRPTQAAKGREKASLNPMQDLAIERGLEVYAPDSINTEEARQKLAAWQPDLLVVCDYGQILSRELLAVAPLGGINLHGSLLPKYRGAAPVHWAVYNGDAETGVTVIHMTPRLDGGPCLAVRRTPIGSDETMAELEQRLSLLGVEAVQEAIEKLSHWDRVSPIGEIQDQSQATKAPRLKKTDGAVDWSRSAEQICNQVRAFKPWPATYTNWLRASGEPLRLILDHVSVISDQGSPNPGEVQFCDGKHLVIATGRDALSIHALQPAGKRVMEIAEFLRGYPVRVGDRFGNQPEASARE